MYAKTKYQEILNQGQSYDEMVSDLFDMYGTARNQRFRDNMARLEDLYNDGTDITIEEIMAKSEVKYHNLKSSGKWGATDPRDAQIVALTTLIKGLVGQQSSSQSSQPNNKKPKKPKATTRNDGQWLVPPVNGELAKVIDGRNAKWCAKCNNGNGKWVVSHDTNSHEENFLQKFRENKNNKTSDNESQPASKKLKINAAMAAAMQTLTGEAVQEVASDEEDF